MAKIALGTRVDSNIHERLELIAAARDWSVSQVIEKCVERGLPLLETGASVLSEPSAKYPAGRKKKS